MRWILVDQLLECEPEKRAVGVKCFSRSDPIFMDHFSYHPVVPGVLQIEMIAQTGGKCIRMAHPKLMTVLGSVKSAKFYRNIEPGSRCIIKVDITAVRSSYALAKGVIEVEGLKCAEAEVMYGMVSDFVPDDAVDVVLEDWKKRQKRAEVVV